MFITGTNEILNVWSNDANKLTIVISIVFFPNLLFLIFSSFKQTNIRQNKIKELASGQYKKGFGIEFIFLFIFISYLICSAGIGQFILKPIFDAVVRAIGIIFFVNGLILRSVFYRITVNYKRNHEFDVDFENEEIIIRKNNIFYSVVRYPQYFFLIIISLGISFLSLNIFGLIITVLILFPVILRRILKEEKIYTDFIDAYIDYKAETPMIIPSIRNIIISRIKK